MEVEVEEALAWAEAQLLVGQYRAALRRVEPLQPDLSGEPWIRAELIVLQAHNYLIMPDVPRSRAVVQRARGTPFEARALLVLGQSLFHEDQSERAERALTRCIRLAEEQGDGLLVAQATAYVGLVCRHRQEMDRAERALREGADGLEAVGARWQAATRLGTLADLVRWMGRFDEADALYTRALKLASPYPKVRVGLLRSRAGLYGQRGDLEAAWKMLQASLEALGDRGGLERSRLLNDLGELARARGKLDEARALLKDALTYRLDGRDTVIRLNLALVDLARGDRAGALATAESLLGKQINPWYRVYAHGLAAACIDDPDALEPHLHALEVAAIRHPYTDRDLHYLFGEAARHTEPRDPACAARFRALQLVQARALGLQVEEVDATLVALRQRGAPVPLGPLDVREEVGHGGMGRIWRGHVRGTDIEVAVKVLDPDRAGDERVVRALNRELRAVARLDHPHIVPLVDYNTVHPAADMMTGGTLAAGTPWLATRWAAHGTLERWCGRRPWAQVREALLQLLDALAAAHAHGLLHLDVKPANVLVASERPLVTWLSDFGIARAVGGGEGQLVAGTPAFMAPEQCLGRTGELGPWTDLYAVGGAAVALVQGHPPFHGRSREVMQQQISRPIPPLQPLQPVPEGFEAWCLRLLAKDPTHRFRCAADAADALRALEAPAASRSGEAPPSVAESSSSTFHLDLVERLELPTEPVDAPPEDGVGRIATMPSHPPRTRVRPVLPELAWAAHRLLPLRRVPLVGREAEQARLWEALWQVERGVGVLRLQAPRGGGRRHLLRWLAEVATRTGAARVIRVEDATDDPWRVALARLLHLHDAPDTQLAKRLQLHIGRGLDEPVTQALLYQALAGPQDARGPLDPLPILLRLIHALARERRVLVCVETADPGAAWMVEQLRRQTPDLPVLVVGLHEALPDEGAETVRLAAVGPDALEALVDALVPLDPTLRAQVVEAARGQPATVVWTLRTWLADRRLMPSPTGLRLRSPDDLPTSPGQALQHALEPILVTGRAHRRRLEVAAVLGPWVDRGTWAAACEAADTSLDPQLVDDLVDRGLLQEHGSGFRFADAGMRQVVLDGVREADRPLLHRAAAAVATEDGDRGRHLLQAGDPIGAMAALSRAIHRDCRRAPRVARAHYRVWEQAREASGLPEDHPEVARGRLAGWRLDPPSADRLPELERLATHARTAGDRDAEALALLLRVSVAWHTEPPSSLLALPKRAQQRAEAPWVQALAQHLLGMIHIKANQPALAAEAFRSALQAGAASRWWLALALQAAGREDEALRCLDAVEPAEEILGYEEAALCLAMAARLADDRGLEDLADRRLGEAVALAAVSTDYARTVALGTQLLPALRRATDAHLDDLRARFSRLLPRASAEVAVALLTQTGSPSERLRALRELLLGEDWGVERGELAALLDAAAERSWWAPVAPALRDLAARFRSPATDPGS